MKQINVNATFLLNIALCSSLSIFGLTTESV